MVRTDLNYSVFYVELASGKDITEPTVAENQTFGTIVDIAAKDVSGFTAVAPTTAQIEITVGTNEHTFYYAVVLPPTPPVDPDSRFTVEGPDDTVYNGESQKQPVTITDKETGKELKEGTDCIITYSDDTTNVGTVIVTITGIGNYDGVMTTTYQITSAPLTITVDDKTKKLGEDDPEFTSKVEGLQGSDTEESLGIEYNREEGEDAGEYAITATYVDNPNYEITVNDGKLTIEPAEYKITFDPNGGIVRGSTEPYVMTVEVDKIGGVDITIIEAAERAGYTFLYWRGSEYQPGDTYTVTEDHTFTAEWEKNAEKPALPKTGDDRGTTAGLLGGMSLLSLFALVIARHRMRDDEEVVA
ncbi:MAG: InlB B-repeat-containing protein [Eggerthellaceae bacterium]|nr:InlB B-repeat-containing protein [Eggerthellaceae bacterium]